MNVFRKYDESERNDCNYARLSKTRITLIIADAIACVYVILLREKKNPNAVNQSTGQGSRAQGRTRHLKSVRRIGK